jgi:hypothetical protein
MGELLNFIHGLSEGECWFIVILTAIVCESIVRIFQAIFNKKDEPFIED